MMASPSQSSVFREISVCKLVRFYVIVFVLNILELNTHWSENVKSVMVVKSYKQIAELINCPCIHH